MLLFLLNELLFFLVFIDNGYVTFFTLDNNVPERPDVDMFLKFFKKCFKISLNDFK